ncbi:MAG: ATP-binding protein [Bacilli bacterium]|nr:ATP-binding protein [Bacilli bacterium]
MIHMLVGVQGSGKSSFAKEMSEKENIEIVSSDAIRRKFKGIEEYKVWEIVYNRMAEIEKEGKDCIFDATSITRNVRKRFFDNMKNLGCNPKVDCIYLDTDIDICEKRIIERNKDENQLFLPPEVIYSYKERLEIPSVDEGFEKVIVVRNYTYE